MFTKRNQRCAVLATGIVVLMAAGCGSSSSTSTTKAATPTTVAAGGASTPTTAAAGGASTPTTAKAGGASTPTTAKAGGASTPTTAGGGAGGAGGKRACVILPDADSGTRWESGDRPALDAAMKAAGFSTDIQNAQKDPQKYATLGDQQLAKGCGVMILVDLQGSGASVSDKAHAQGIPVIAYDRPIKGADYYVSFDNKKVGALQGQTIVDGLKAAGKTAATASVVFSSGDPADGNAKMFLDGATEVLTKAGVKAAFTMTGTWDGDKAGTLFEQAYTALGGKIDAVLAPNDNNAAAIITILDKNKITAVISGQDASVAGLQNVLLGKQTATVYKPFKVEAKSASDLAIELLNGKKPTAPAKLDDGTPFVPNEPILVTADKVEQVVTAGDAKAADICTAAVAAACTKNGVK